MFLTVCVIAYNEEKTLPLILADISGQDYEHSSIEVVLVDSASTDSTKKIMQEFAACNKDFAAVKVIDNPKRTLPCGWNEALRVYSGEAILKVDAHARIPKDFVTKNVNALERGEDIVGGERPNVIDDDTPWNRTLLMAESSMFGSSIAPYRRNPGPAYVKSMFHAAYRRRVFDKIGGFNEKLGRTEDNEIHYRMRKAGFRLCFDPDIISYQHIRSSLPKMLKQKYSNGYWIALTTGVCPECLSLYHYVPFAFVMAIIVLGIARTLTQCIEPLSAAAMGVTVITAIMWGAYWLLAVAMAALAVVTAKPEQRSLPDILLPVLFFLLHVSYGLGTLAGFVQLPAFVRQYKKQ